MTGSETACAHGRLAFASGGEVVTCLDCPDTWRRVPRAGDEDRQPDLGLGRGDVRLSPRLMPPPPKASNGSEG